jgi:hypothetical protein
MEEQSMEELGREICHTINLFLQSFYGEMIRDSTLYKIDNMVNNYLRTLELEINLVLSHTELLKWAIKTSPFVHAEIHISIYVTDRQLNIGWYVYCKPNNKSNRKY